jgi:TIR domain
MDPLKVFVSHSSQYAELAKSLKLSLQALESTVRLDIKISEEMAGSTNWRLWIDENVRTSDVFLLIYPHMSMEMGWCNYELGRFYDETRHVICIKNVDIAKPPPAFEPYQAYTGDEDGILKFLNEMFVIGSFTSGEPFNAAVGQIGSTFYARAKDVSREISQKFADARIRDRYYERRVVLSVQYTNQRFDPDKTTIAGNVEGLNILGLNTESSVSWSAARAKLGDDFAWPSDLEAALPSIAVGEIPPALTPFPLARQIYIPVVARAATVDNVLRSIVLIFVAADAEQLRPLLDWATPPAMTEQFSSLIRLIRMMLRARWDVLEPNYQELLYRAPPKERRAAIVASIIAGFDRLRRDSERLGVASIDRFYSVFDRELRPGVASIGADYAARLVALQSTPADNAEDVLTTVKAMLDNNAAWLQVASKQFSISVADLGIPIAARSPAVA